jgi:hypothetical protein
LWAAVFDRTEDFKQWGVLFGDEKPEHSPMTEPAMRDDSEMTQQQLARENKIEPPHTD